MSYWWFDRLYEKCTQSQPPIDEWLLEYKLSNAMEAAVENGHMEIVQRIHSLHPQRLPVELLPLAAGKGDLPMLQWLFENRTDSVCTPERIAIGDDSVGSTGLLPCCLHNAYSQAVRTKQFHVAKWLLENGYRGFKNLRGLGNEAASAGDLEMVTLVTHPRYHHHDQVLDHDQSRHPDTESQATKTHYTTHAQLTSSKADTVTTPFRHGYVDVRAVASATRPF